MRRNAAGGEGATDPELEAIHLAAASRLRAHQQRYTAGRRLLVETMAAHGHPLAVPDLLAALPVTAQSSVYRNLSVLEVARVARRVQGEDELNRFELAEDLTGHHHHLLCTACGKVADYTLPPRLERAVENAIPELASITGFHPKSHRLDLVGLCSACA